MKIDPGITYYDKLKMKPFYKFTYLCLQCRRSLYFIVCAIFLVLTTCGLQNPPYPVWRDGGMEIVEGCTGYCETDRSRAGDVCLLFWLNTIGLTSKLDKKNPVLSDAEREAVRQERDGYLAIASYCEGRLESYRNYPYKKIY